MNIPAIHISDYAYELPEEKIALYPLSERDQSKLLIWNEGQISQSVFSQIDHFLPEQSMLVFNNTRVIHARLHFHTESGAQIEVFCLEPHSPADYQISFAAGGQVEWKCLVGNARKWKRGILQREVALNDNVASMGGTNTSGILKPDGYANGGEDTNTHGSLHLEVAQNVDKFILSAEMLGREGDAFIIRFAWDQPLVFADVIEAAGEVPIPPYLNRQADESDTTRYQTMYAQIDGSVAAPTAGLHFTPEVMHKLHQKLINTAELTLHVGAGTFQPVKSEKVSDHPMHAETVVITRQFLEKLVSHPGKLIAVGTTSVRSLESLYWLGAKIKELLPGEELKIEQWEPYQKNSDVSPQEALIRLIDWMVSHKISHFSFSTSIIIVPGYTFRFINGMITNFHQPQSTLLLLVSAFIGHDWKEVYDYALRNDFRFLSYGDSNLYLAGAGLSQQSW